VLTHLRPTLLAALLLVTALTIGCDPPSRATANWVDHSPHQIHFVAVAPGVSLEVLDWGGTGPAVVFLSGLQDVAHGFDDFAPSFTDQYHVVGVTRRGYGASSQAPTGYDVATRVADLRAVLDSLQLSKVALVGHSIAGDELTAFAGAYPERVSHLVYLDAAYDHSGIEALIAGWPAPPPMLAADSASPKAVRAYLLRAFGQHIPEAQLRAIGRYDASDHLVGNVTPTAIDSQMLAGCGHPNYRPIHAPALVIDAVVDSAPQLFPNWSTMDSTNRAAGLSVTKLLQAWEATERARLHRELPSAKVLGLHGANHYVFDSNRSEVTKAMRAFLAAR
jgi:pimeloyl-ACP methyl ester carboxylesterase